MDVRFKLNCECRMEDPEIVSVSLETQSDGAAVESVQTDIRPTLCDRMFQYPGEFELEYCGTADDDTQIGNGSNLKVVITLNRGCVVNSFDFSGELHIGNSVIHLDKALIVTEPDDSLTSRINPPKQVKEDLEYIPDCKFEVTVRSGEVFVNGKFIQQLCYDADSVGYAVAAYLKGELDEDKIKFEYELQ